MEIFNINITRKPQLSNFIYIKNNALPKSFCDNVIEKFEKDDRKYQGTTADGVELDIKRSLDLYISALEDWKSFDEVFFESLNKNLNEYWKQLPTMFKGGEMVEKYEDDTGYQIQKTKPGDFYTWHSDAMTDGDGNLRVVTFIWYLNDVKHDGYTEFVDGTKIQPEAGKIVIFPSTWEYLHRGVCPKSETKYICTGWVF